MYASARWTERHEHRLCLLSFVKDTTPEKRSNQEHPQQFLRTDVRSSHHTCSSLSSIRSCLTIVGHYVDCLHRLPYLTSLTRADGCLVRWVVNHGQYSGY